MKDIALVFHAILQHKEARREFLGGLKRMSIGILLGILAVVVLAITKHRPEEATICALLVILGMIPAEFAIHYSRASKKLCS